ncbi:MAG TPA: dockerin type I domain-containing protein, partial [Sedimentisphaerales bacterium]|nr:dockerin type I domain-containing protein [Sedimentisphaerales bacterium]
RGEDIVDSYTLVLFGDLNGDGNVDTADAGLIVDYENFLVEWDPAQDAAYLKAADLNGDGNVDTADAGLIVDVENFLLTIDQTTGLAL